MMTNRVQRSSAFAWCLILGGICFIGRAAAALAAGPPPSSGIEILAWINDARGAMILGNEALVIGAGLLIAGFYGIQQAFYMLAPMKATAGSAFLFAASVVCLVLGIVQGRFVYPIHGISLTRPEDAELLASLYFGGYHLVALALAVATTFWSFAMLKAAKWVPLGYLGFAVAAGSVLSSYPDLIGPILVFVLESSLAFWWIVIGLWLLRSDGAESDASA